MGGLPVAGGSPAFEDLIAREDALESTRRRRLLSGRTPALPEETVLFNRKSVRGSGQSVESLEWSAAVLPVGADGKFAVRVEGEVADGGGGDFRLFVNGALCPSGGTVNISQAK